MYFTQINRSEDLFKGNDSFILLARINEEEEWNNKLEFLSAFEIFILTIFLTAISGLFLWYAFIPLSLDYSLTKVFVFIIALAIAAILWMHYVCLLKIVLRFIITALFLALIVMVFLMFFNHLGSNFYFQVKLFSSILLITALPFAADALVKLITFGLPKKPNPSDIDELINRFDHINLLDAKELRQWQQEARAKQKDGPKNWNLKKCDVVVEDRVLFIEHWTDTSSSFLGLTVMQRNC